MLLDVLVWPVCTRVAGLGQGRLQQLRSICDWRVRGVCRRSLLFWSANLKQPRGKSMEASAPQPVQKTWPWAFKCKDENMKVIPNYQYNRVLGLAPCHSTKFFQQRLVSIPNFSRQNDTLANFVASQSENKGLWCARNQWRWLCEIILLDTPLRSVLFKHLHDGGFIANLEDIYIKICITKLQVRWDHANLTLGPQAIAYLCPKIGNLNGCGHLGRELLWPGKQRFLFPRGGIPEVVVVQCAKWSRVDFTGMW